jgi:ATP-binding cassette subfamily B protein
LSVPAGYVASTKKTYIDPKSLPRLDGTMLRRILLHLRPYRRDGLLVLLAMGVAAVLNLTPPLLVKHAIDVAIARRDLTLLLVDCAGMVALPLLAGGLAVRQKLLTSRIGERVMLDLRVALFEHLQRQPYSYFVQARPGEALSSVLNDVQGIGSVVSGTLANVVESVIVLGLAALLVAALDWRLALAALLILPIFAISGRRVGQKRKELRRAAQSRLAELTGILDESLSASGALLIKLYGAERLELERLRQKANELMELNLRQIQLGRWFQMFVSAFESVALALVFGLGGYLIMRGQLALGTVVAFVTLLRRLYPPAAALAGVQVDLLTSYAYFERVFRVLDLQPGIRTTTGALQLGRPAGRLQFRGVSLTMPDGGQLLRDVELDIAPGQCVALVGPSGAGKSTLAFLVPRLLDPSAGQVLLDGVDLRDLELASLRAHIGIVTQDTYLFYGSVLDNLRYAKPDATMDAVEAAARAAQIHEMIAALPERYQTLVGRGGNRLSGGERQRLSIARAILKDPRILILDEATSSVDALSEMLIQAALVPLLEGRTSLVIAHRLSTIRLADVIVVVDNGRIVERGSHRELLARSGLYARLYEEQLKDAVARPA